MSDIIPLQIYPWPVDEVRMNLIKQAKATLNLELKVLPTQAVPGLHARVLALGKLPPWLCDAALVRDPSNVDSVQAALEWVLTAPEGDERGFMVKDYMHSIFGEPVLELSAPKCHCGDNRAVQNYQLQPGCTFCNEAGCHLTEGICFRD